MAVNHSQASDSPRVSCCWFRKEEKVEAMRNLLEASASDFVLPSVKWSVRMIPFANYPGQSVDTRPIFPVKNQ